MGNRHRVEAGDAEEEQVRGETGLLFLGPMLVQLEMLPGALPWFQPVPGQGSG